MVTQLGNEELLNRFASQARSRRTRREPVLASVRGIDERICYVLIVHLITFDPGAEEAFRNIILDRAGAHAVAASNAFVDIDQHGPPVVADVVVRRSVRCSGKKMLPSDGGSTGQC